MEHEKRNIKRSDSNLWVSLRNTKWKLNVLWSVFTVSKKFISHVKQAGYTVFILRLFLQFLKTMDWNGSGWKIKKNKTFSFVTFTVSILAHMLLSHYLQDYNSAIGLQRQIISLYIPESLTLRSRSERGRWKLWRQSRWLVLKIKR